MRQNKKRERQRQNEIAYDERLKAKGIRYRSFRLSDEQHEKVKAFIKEIKTVDSSS